MNNWQLASNIFLGLGIAGLVVGLLLRCKVGRWILALLLICLFVVSLVEGSDDWTNLSFDTPLHKISRFSLITGGCCVAIALLIRSFSLLSYLFFYKTCVLSHSPFSKNT